MSQTTFQTISADAMLAMHDRAWHGALAALKTPAVEAPVSYVMPYFAAQAQAAAHTDNCETCSTGSFLELCPEGDALFSIAADACAAQSDLAVQN